MSRDIAPGEEVKQDGNKAEKRLNLGGGMAEKPHDRKNDKADAHFKI